MLGLARAAALPPPPPPASRRVRGVVDAVVVSLRGPSMCVTSLAGADDDPSSADRDEAVRREQVDLNAVRKKKRRGGEPHKKWRLLRRGNMADGRRGFVG
jgi:hypothetical protein